MHSVYRTVEVTAASMDFTYEDYVRLHTEAKCIGALVSEKGYKHLRDFFDWEVELSNKDTSNNPIEPMAAQYAYGWIDEEPRNPL